MQCSEEQCLVAERVLECMEDGGHVLVEAVAGAGKTRTLLYITERVLEQRPKARILLAAFNVEMVATLQARLPVGDTQVDTCTLHALGLRLCMQQQQLAPSSPPVTKRQRRHGVSVDPDKMLHVVQSLAPDVASNPEAWGALRRDVDEHRQRGLPFEVQGMLPQPLWETVMTAMLADRTCVDQEDQIYQPLFYKVQVPELYDLVLLDESQDLNPAQHLFLRHCVVPAGSRTVLCAVGDSHQAVYAFRGADPRSMKNLCSLFSPMHHLDLNHCFRCPRRVVLVAHQVNQRIRPVATAEDGTIRVLCCQRSQLAATALRMSAAEQEAGRSVLICRFNNQIVDILADCFRAKDHTVRWISPATLQRLRQIRDSHLAPDLQGLAHALGHARAQSPILSEGYRLFLHIVERGLQLEPASVSPQASAWFQYLEDALVGPCPCPSLTIATVHAIKGMEFEHAMVFEYNLLGLQNQGSDQEDNILYIALTRPTKTLTLILDSRSRHVVSPLLPLEVIQMIAELPIPQ